MKRVSLLFWCLIATGVHLPAAPAVPQPTAFEKAIYDRARQEVVSKLNDDDFVSYCVTMNVGGDTLLHLHDEILTKQTELIILKREGFADDYPQIVALNSALKDLNTQMANKIVEARRGLEIEARIAEATLTGLGEYQK